MISDTEYTTVQRHMANATKGLLKDHKLMSCPGLQKELISVL